MQRWVAGMTIKGLTTSCADLVASRAMANAQGKLEQEHAVWHRDAAVVSRGDLRVDPEVARLRIARTLELLTAEQAGTAGPPESRVVPSSKPDASARESGTVPSSKPESAVVPSSKRRGE